MSNPYGAPQPYQQTPGSAPERGRGGGRGPGVTEETRRARKRAVITMLIGGLTMVFAPMIGLGIAGMNLAGLVTQSELRDYQVISDPGTTSVLESGNWTAMPNNTERASQCVVTDSTGAELPVSTSFNAVVQFELTAPGQVRIDCGGRGQIHLLPTDVVDAILGNIGGVGVPVIIGVVLAGFGLITLIVGIIWYIRAEQPSRRGPGGPGGPGLGQPYGYGVGGPYGQPGAGQPSGQPPYGQPSGQPPYGQPSGQPPYGQPSGQPPYGQPSGQPPYGQPSGQPPYAQPSGQPPYGQPGAGQANWGEGPSSSQIPPTNYGQSPDEPPRYGERI